MVTKSIRGIRNKIHLEREKMLLYKFRETKAKKNTKKIRVTKRNNLFQEKRKG